jgi:hypothetical protein
LEPRQQWRTKNYHSSYRNVPTIRAEVEAAEAERRMVSTFQKEIVEVVPQGYDKFRLSGNVGRTIINVVQRHNYILLLSSHPSHQVHNYGGLIAIRMALGFCEGGLLPGLVCDKSFLHRFTQSNVSMIFYSQRLRRGQYRPYRSSE